ncbi:MAG TPA: L,D-transpeptidase [Acidobacteriaceae bacterium]|nr:L,D-transpeptidase [Acidobacteriaceae bacterium]
MAAKRIAGAAAITGLAMWLALAAVVQAAEVVAPARQQMAARVSLPASQIALTNTRSTELIAPVAAVAVPGLEERTILVSLADRKLALVVNGEVRAVYPVAVGKASTPSPVGEFTIVNRVENPTYWHKGKVVRPGPGNPVGTRWMGLSEKGYGIHGTNEPRSIGKRASHGCIRMGRRDLEALFAQVRAGDAVEIRGERDAEMARVFDTPTHDDTAVVNGAPATLIARNDAR